MIAVAIKVVYACDGVSTQPTALTRVVAAAKRALELDSWRWYLPRDRAAGYALVVMPLPARISGQRQEVFWGWQGC